MLEVMPRTLTAFFADMLFFKTLSLLAVVVAVVSAKSRDKSFKACDKSPDSHKLNKNGQGLVWEVSDDPNFYTKPGHSSCGYTYTNDSNVVCVSPGWVNSANVNGCNKWVEVYLSETGASVQGLVWDACGALKNTTFGCNDIYLSKQMFEELAGDQKDAALAAGQLPGQVSWRFIDEPCWGCAAGLPGKFPNGTIDTCEGRDATGFLRCGRRQGSSRVVGEDVKSVCSKTIDSCDKCKSPKDT